MVKGTKEMSVRPSPPPTGDNGDQLNSSGLTWQSLMSMGPSPRMSTMQLRIRRKKHCKLMMNQRRMVRAESIAGLSWESVMSSGIGARMVTLRIRRKNLRKPMMDQGRMWRTE